MRQEVRWTNLSRRNISRQLEKTDTPASKNVVSKVLYEEGFRRRKPQKKRTMGQNKDRDVQFRNLKRLKQEYLEAGKPVLRNGHEITSTFEVFNTPFGLSLSKSVAPPFDASSSSALWVNENGEIISGQILSMDTKKKEILGNFYREGVTDAIEPTIVNDHDFWKVSRQKSTIWRKLKRRRGSR